MADITAVASIGPCSTIWLLKILSMLCCFDLLLAGSAFCRSLLLLLWWKWVCRVLELAAAFSLIRQQRIHQT
jgi:hypothetical protein